MIALQSYGQFKPFSFFNTGNVLSPDAIQYKRLIDSVGGSITTGDLLAFSTFTKDIISIRNKIIRFNPFGGNTLTTALVPAIRGTGIGIFYGSALDINVNFIVGNFSRSSGLGDPSNTTKYLKTGVIPTTTSATLNSTGLGFWGLTNRSAASLIALGCNDAGNTNRIYVDLRFSSDNYGVAVNCGGTPAVGTSSSTVGLFYFSRTTSTLTTVYYNGNSATTSSTVSSAIPATEFYVFCKNNNGTPTSFETINSSGYIITTGLTTSEQLILYNAWNKLKAAWGR